jgi:hypothetical protein
MALTKKKKDENRKLTVRINGNLADIQTKYLPNTSLQLNVYLKNTTF